jgi:Holliday junction resolvase
MRKRARKDTTHAPMVADFRKMGMSVLDLSQLGDDCPDLLVGWGGDECLVEVKSSKKVHKKKGDGRSPGQIEFAHDWAGRPVICAETAEQVCKKLGWI